MKTFKMTFVFIAVLTGSVLFTSCQEDADKAKEAQAAVEQDLTNIIKELKIENLLRDSLALAPDVEVIMSYLEVPPAEALPLHYHPGEEFVYMLEGGGDLTIEGELVNLGEGDIYKIPIRAKHSFATKDQACKGVVFRVHEKGQPDRFLIER